MKLILLLLAVTVSAQRPNISFDLYAYFNGLLEFVFVCFKELMLTSIATVFVAIFTILYAFIKYRQSKMHRVRVPDGVDMATQMIEISPGVYKSGLLVDRPELTMDSMWPEVKTLYDAFLRGKEVSGNGPCLGHRPGPGLPYQFLSYAVVLKKSRDFSSALVGLLGLKPGNTTHVGVYGKNSPEWFISALGSIQQSIVIVPLYDTLGPEAAIFAVQQTEISVIVVDTVEKARGLLSKKAQMPNLKHVVIIEVHSLPKEFDDHPSGVKVHSFMDVLQDGNAKPQKMFLPKPDDTYIICYTSGTTGQPKGVICTHKMLVSDISSLAFLVNSFHPNLFGNREALISYLPLSHMMEQLDHFFTLVIGGRLGYYSGNIANLVDDMKAFQPTLLPVVPRLLNRLYDTIQAKVRSSGPITRTLYNYAYKQKLALLKQGIAGNTTIWDKLVFAKIQAQLGGKVKFMCTGSAPVSAEVLETARVAFGAVCLEAYGQTECTAAASFSWPGDYTAGHVGSICACATMKLADVPDLQYFASEGKGEICIKGPSVTKGYFKDPEKTAELFDEDGFLHTGDVGQMLPNGKFKIIDRKKHIFKLAQGEYVAPEKIENIYVRAPVVQQVFVDGNSLERFLVAVVVPDAPILEQWYKGNVKDNGVSLEQMVKQKQVRDYILAELQKIGKESKLNSMEQVKAVHVTSDPFSIENGLLTPTMKSKRPQLRKHFADVIENLYVEATASGA